jgi:hypothetical protein
MEAALLVALGYLAIQAPRADRRQGAAIRRVQP